MLGGAEILQIININHQILRLGYKLIIPLFNNKLRLPTRSYIILAKQKSPDEHKPCPIIKIKPPFILILFKLNIELIIKPICAIEEYAIKAFKST